MGFGKKTDYSDVPRTLDLDRTYEAIIKPAVTAAGLDCIRADEVSHAGIIDKPMYEMLLRADLVIADISTANPNALYELGVRHALRPFSTIVIKEVEGKFIFDLNHLATLQYKHLGEDIGTKEASLKIAELKKLIDAVVSTPRLDSPVYTFLQGLVGPTMTEKEFKAAVAEAKTQSDSLAQALDGARRATEAKDPVGASQFFHRAYDLQAAARQAVDPSGTPLPDPYIVQQFALHTYKAKKPSELEALRAAETIIGQLDPRSSTDPETLGISGAIQKRLYSATKDLDCLEAAIDMYGRGFELKKDYYNGENYAICLDWRADRQSRADEADYDRKTARKVRERIVAFLNKALSDEDAVQRPDYRWMVATMANTLSALGLDGEKYEAEFRKLARFAWELETFTQGKNYALRVAELPKATLDMVASAAQSVVDLLPMPR
jgi:hypothetical protein